MDHHDNQHHDGKRKMSNMPVFKEVLHQNKSVDSSVQRNVMFYQGYNTVSVGTGKIILFTGQLNTAYCPPVFKMLPC